MSKTQTKPAADVATFDFPIRQLDKSVADALFGLAEAEIEEADEHNSSTLDPDSARQIMAAIKAGDGTARVPLTDEGDAVMWLALRVVADNFGAAVTAARTFDPSNTTGIADDGDVWLKVYEARQAVRLFDDYRRARACQAVIESEGPDVTLTIDDPNVIASFRVSMDWTESGEAADGITHILGAKVLEQLDAGDTITAPREWLLRQLAHMIEGECDELDDKSRHEVRDHIARAGTLSRYIDVIEGTPAVHQGN